MAPVLACRVLPSIEVTMGYERDDNTRWGNWPHTSMVQAVKNMGARHNGREPYISFTDDSVMHVYMHTIILHYYSEYDSIPDL